MGGSEIGRAKLPTSSGVELAEAGRSSMHRARRRYPPIERPCRLPLRSRLPLPAQSWPRRKAFLSGVPRDRKGEATYFFWGGTRGGRAIIHASSPPPRVPPQKK